MIETQIRKRGRCTRLMFAAKISDHQFRAVLWQFVLDRSAYEAAKHVRLSSNSISTIYRKLRRFFYDLGVFRDPYRGQDPIAGLDVGEELSEHALLSLHLKRVRAKRNRLDDDLAKPAHHLAETHWRAKYVALRREREAHHADQMMFDNLLEFIKAVGPVGRRLFSKQDRLLALRLILKHQDQELLWLERNSVAFRDAKAREGLRAIRNS